MAMRATRRVLSYYRENPGQQDPFKVWHELGTVYLKRTHTHTVMTLMSQHEC